MAVYRYNYGIDFTYEMLYRLYVVEKFGSREMERIFGGVHHRVIEYMQWYYKIQPKRQYDGKIEATIKQGKTKQAILVYEQLCLKFPLKSTYFAAHIQKLKQKI